MHARSHTHAHTEAYVSFQKRDDLRVEQLIRLWNLHWDRLAAVRPSLEGAQTQTHVCMHTVHVEGGSGAIVK